MAKLVWFQGSLLISSNPLPCHFETMRQNVLFFFLSYHLTHWFLLLILLRSLRVKGGEYVSLQSLLRPFHKDRTNQGNSHTHPFFFVLWRIIGKVHLSVCPILLIRGSPQETVGWVCTNKKMLNKLIWSHPGSVSCLAAGRHSFDHPLSFPIC